ncbi:MAG: OsmC family protein [Rhodospirillaceae bacterium]|jgi:uncharacterized OsmC-like protein|nr:OsmC family protein [Rhodospirillaceae bacterium]MBT5665113.1 OsmC family protein [Rhodospirillaceae bacterium]
MSFPEANEFLGQTGPLSGNLLDECAKLDGPPAGFERVWAAFEPMEAMQKRGQILRLQTGEAWQFLCDEGAALGGADWAPPPLAYFAAGMACSVTGAVVEKAAAHGIPAEAISVVVNNNYSLRGSILRGTMDGLGHNPDVSVTIDSDALSAPEKSGLAFEAVSSVLAGYLMKSVFISEFNLIANGAPVSLDLSHWDWDGGVQTLPSAALDTAGGASGLGTPYVSKNAIRPDDPTFDASGGSGVDVVQNRSTVVSATAKAAANGVITSEAGIARPGASVYGFLGASDAGTAGAPSSASLMAAGIGFCFMTQLGRYAEAMKRPVHDYRMIQSIDIPLPGSDGSQTPVIGTKLFLNQDEADESFAQDLLHSARRTCFLHSTLQASLRSKIVVG